MTAGWQWAAWALSLLGNLLVYRVGYRTGRRDGEAAPRAGRVHYGLCPQCGEPFAAHPSTVVREVAP